MFSRRIAWYVASVQSLRAFTLAWLEFEGCSHIKLDLGTFAYLGTILSTCTSVQVSTCFVQGSDSHIISEELIVDGMQSFKTDPRYRTEIHTKMTTASDGRLVYMNNPS